MRFAELSAMWLLAFPLAAAVMLVVQIFVRRRVISSVGDGVVVKSQLRRASAYLRAASGIILVLGMGLLVVASTRPQYGGRVQMLKKRGIDIVVALDFSKSMLAQDVAPNRIERAKLELTEFMNKLTGDRVGLVAFAGDTMRFPLTNDYQAATMFWKDLGPYDMPVGGTAIGKALTDSLEMLYDHRDDGGPGKSRSKVILLMTDGEDHEGEPLEVAKEAARKGVRVFTVGIGSDSPELIPRYLDDGTTMGYQKDQDGEYVTTALTAKNEQVLQQIAADTGGRYVRAGADLSGLGEVVAAIRNLKQSEIESRRQVLFEEVFQWFLIPAFLLLVLAYVLPERRRRADEREARS